MSSWQRGGRYTYEKKICGHLYGLVQTAAGWCIVYDDRYVDMEPDLARAKRRAHTHSKQTRPRRVGGKR